MTRDSIKSITDLYMPSYSKLVEMQREINQLKRCVKNALNHRPLPTDPYQEFVKMVSPETLEEWRKENES